MISILEYTIACAVCQLNNLVACLFCLYYLKNIAFFNLSISKSNFYKETC